MSALNVEDGITIHVEETASQHHTILVREGCSGSKDCALEVYVDAGNKDPYGGLNLHFSEGEARDLRRALDAVNFHRQRAQYQRAKGDRP